MMSLSPERRYLHSDGDYNSRVVHFSKDGNFIKIIAARKDPRPVNSIVRTRSPSIRKTALVLDEQVDAHNPRVQVFDQNGGFFNSGPTSV